jgi:predicted nucleic acid-binding protein
MDCFDADVLIFAADVRYPLGARVRALFAVPPDHTAVGIGSVLLLAEVLSKPLRDDRDDQLGDLVALLARLDLRPLDLATAQLATALAAQHGLRAADAVHLATAVAAGADRFITNHRKDFPKSITEVDIVYPDDLADA